MIGNKMAYIPALTTSQVEKLRHNPKDNAKPTRYGINSKLRLYLYCYRPLSSKDKGRRVFYYKSKKGEYIKLNEFTALYGLSNANEAALVLKNKDNLGSIDKQELKKEQILGAKTLNDCFNECFKDAFKLIGEKDSQQYERSLARRKNANRYIHKWILNQIGDKKLSQLNKELLIEIFLRPKYDETPSLETMQKNLSVLKHILRVAKQNGLIKDYDFIEAAQKQLNQDLKDYNHAPKKRQTLLTPKYDLDLHSTSALIKSVLHSKTAIHNKLLFAFMALSPQRQGERAGLDLKLLSDEVGLI